MDKSHGFFKRLNQSRLLLIFLLLTALIFFFEYISNIYGLDFYNVIRYYGIALQVTGYLLLISVIDRIMKRFYSYGIKGFMLISFHKIFGIKLKILGWSITVPSANYNYQVNPVTVETLPSENLKEVIDYFHKKMVGLSQRIEEVRRDGSNKIAILKNEMESRDGDILTKIEKTETLIADVSAPKVGFELFVIFVMILGSICTSVPEFIVWILI